MLYFNLTEKEWDKLENIFREVVRSNSESNESRALAENPDGITDIICKFIENYVENHGLSYEDCRVILED